MILSCSRRTDIPAFYSEWFMNRLREKSVCVVNPFNSNQISRILLSPEVIDCIVFWTKNPKPLMSYLNEIDTLGYKYYFQFTITPYQKDIESGISDKSEIIETFVKLSQRIGKEKIIFRYDPIIITDKYDLEYHVKAFRKLCAKLRPYTDKVIISFVDMYRKNKKNLEQHSIQEMNNDVILEIASKLKAIADENKLLMETCAESIELSQLGIAHGKCIDGELIERITGYKVLNKDKRDANREYCGCMQCIDIGQYDTCLYKCAYCYANVNGSRAEVNYKHHNPLSEVLIGEVDETNVTVRKGVKSFRIDESIEQLKLDL